MSIALSATEHCPPSPAAWSTAGPSGRLREMHLTDGDRNWAIALHLLPFAAAVFFFFAFAPLIIWLIRKNDSPFDDDHGREVVNMQLTSLLLSFLLFVLGFLTFGLGWLMIAVWHVIIIIAQIRGAVAAGNGEYFRYPMIIRFIP